MKEQIYGPSFYRGLGFFYFQSMAVSSKLRSGGRERKGRERPLLDTFVVLVLSLLLFHDVGLSAPHPPTLSLDDKKVIHAQGEGPPPPSH